MSNEGTWEDMDSLLNSQNLQLKSTGSGSPLDDLLNSNIGDTPATKSIAAIAASIRKSQYRRLVAFQNVFSHSTQEVLHGCPRKFALTKLNAHHEVEREVVEGNITFSFGHAVGAGVATYDRTRDVSASLFAAFLSWDMDLLARTPEGSPGKPKKLEEFHHVVNAIQLYALFVEEEGLLEEYDVIKVEATIAVDLLNGFFYTGHIDELLQSKTTGQLLVKENKTIGARSVHPAQYSNSNQALSYSAATSALGSTEYTVLYTIYSKPEQRWMKMDFVKPPIKRVHWLQTQAMLSSVVQMYSAEDFFPMQGGNCLAYNHPCQFYEDCEISFNRRFGSTFKDLPVCAGFEDLEAIEPLDFKVTWDDVMNAQVN